MRSRGAAALAVMTLLGVAACSGGGDAASPTTSSAVDRVQLGEVVEGEGTTDGLELVGFDDEVVRLSDYEGLPVVVNLFASWCGPCVREMPAIERVKQDVGDDVAFLGIATNDRVEDAAALVERTGITWDVARDPQGEAATTLGAVRMPTTFLVGADGEIVEHHGGALTEGELRDLLREHFGIDA